MFDDVAEYIDSQLNLGLDWPVVVEQACTKFDIANRELIEQIYNDWVDGR